VIEMIIRAGGRGAERQAEHGSEQPAHSYHLVALLLRPTSALETRVAKSLSFICIGS
jgi:hypothetical protein